MTAPAMGTAKCSSHIAGMLCANTATYLTAQGTTGENHSVAANQDHE